MLVIAAQAVFLVIYLFAVIMVVIYGVHRYWLAYTFVRHRDQEIRPKGRLEKLPVVTVQLPLYNEAFVAERIITTTCRIDYPRHLLEIQVLDDSTDETVDIASGCVERMRAAGCDIKYIHRAHRTGYKAGALQAGLDVARGEFIAIFDADFVPNPEMIRKCIHFFSDESIGMVQTRWGHTNRTCNLLTRGQAIFLDGHFVVEHTARNRTGRFMNFNGTAGIWRRTAIEQSGAWQHDTLTEDLDLSYRAQLAGWRFIYLLDVICPAEIPEDINAFKSQQHRWTKGMIQTARKILPKVLRSSLPLRVKVESFFHLTCSSAYLYVLLMSLAVLPNIRIIARVSAWESFPKWLLVDVPLFALASMSASVFYVVSQREVRRDWWKTILYLPFLMCLGIGMCVNNSRAVLEGLLGHESPFVRTPKYGSASGESFRPAKYRIKTTLIPVIELLLSAYIACAIRECLLVRHYTAIPFLALFALGYLYVGASSLLQSRRAARAQTATA